MAEYELKGKSLKTFPTDFVVLDLETTGLKPQEDSIIEIGILRIRCGSVVDSFSALVDPGFRITDFISNLTGITSEMLSAAAPIDVVLPEALAFIGEDVVVGHNVNFDINFLYSWSLKVVGRPFSNNFVDTLSLSRKLLPDLPHHRLGDLVSVLEITTTEQHRALADCETTYKIFQELKSFNGTPVKKALPQNPPVPKETSSALVSKLIGVSYKNEDGTRRQDLIAELSVGDKLYLDDASDYYSTPDTVVVLNSLGYEVGNLTKPIARKVLPVLRNGGDFLCTVESKTRSNSSYVITVSIDPLPEASSASATNPAERTDAPISKTAPQQSSAVSQPRPTPSAPTKPEKDPPKGDGVSLFLLGLFAPPIILFLLLWCFVNLFLAIVVVAFYALCAYIILSTVFKLK